MKLTKSQLKQIIAEERRRDLREVEVDIANITHENLADVQCDDLLELYKQALEHEEEAVPDIVGAIEARMDDCDDEESDPRGNLGGMVDVDYDDPIVGRRGNLEERKLTKAKLKQIIEEELSEAFLNNKSQGYFDALDGKKRDSGKLGDEDYLAGYEKGIAERGDEEPLKLGTPEEDPMKRNPPSRLRKTVMNK